MNRIDIYDFPGRTMTLELPFEVEQARNGEITRLAIEALQTITGEEIRFYCSDLWIGAFEAENLFPLTEIIEDDSTFLFKRPEIGQPVDCDLYWGGQQVILLQEVQGRLLENAVNHILTERRRGIDPAAVLSWKSIGFRGVRARIRGTLDGTLKVRWANKETDYPVEMEGPARFVYGPRSDSSISAPLTILLQNDGVVISMRITLFWSYWTDDDQEGTRLLQSSIQRLLDNGWKISTT